MLAAAALALTGCRDREITAYRAPKDPAPKLPEMPAGHPPAGQAAADANATPTAPGAMTGTVPTAEGAELLWTAPANWTAKALGSMRKGSYSIAGDAGATADLAITAFPGDTGGLFANVNRWRGQVGLSPIEAAQLDAATQTVEANSLKIIIVEVTGKAGGGGSTTLLGAIVPHNGQTWFFKLMGPEALVAREKPAFREFLNTIKPR
jgi:hypothetical protein